MSTHYPKRRSWVKRNRQFGFRARMKSRSGRRMVNRRRRMGRRINVRRSW